MGSMIVKCEVCNGTGQTEIIVKLVPEELNQTSKKPRKGQNDDQSSKRTQSDQSLSDI